ncbi:putative Tetratricopeptide repeat [Trypanosoma vivax]|uniref:Cdc23 domain-containing protein n=1 Tax=Trypanosoma vivax (strain Y486) TaxID=1055687 RepID=G0TRF8_TRYVY|nr:hypothetical protein TRVL_05545 [Trypanosoma vivax]KAH8603945.1 putative Tetratricopeptide repeat [Trypanosoma vivax]CCC46522.1 conserved hypothetical protein [Trypanosoma vivax Y486]
MRHQEASSGLGYVTVADVLDHSMDQCMQRGLFDTATWLGQLALDASDAVLSETVQSTAPICASMYDPPMTCRERRHHVVALGFMQKGEYLRCHHHLSNVLQEHTVGMCENVPFDNSIVLEGERIPKVHQPPRHHSGRPAPLPVRQTLAAQSQKSREVSGATSVPPQLQFLSFYSLYMAGECIKNTSSNPRKSTNPHLRTVRGLLLEAQGKYQEEMRQLHQQQTASGSSAHQARPVPPSSKSTVRSPPPHTRSPTASSATPGVMAYGDPFLCWLHGVVLRELGMKQESATYFLAAICNHPMLWCAWEDLCTLVSRENQIEEIGSMLSSLEPHFMLEIFLATLKAALNVSPVSFVLPSALGTVSAATTKRSTSLHQNVGACSDRGNANENKRQYVHSRRGVDVGHGVTTSPRPVNSWEKLLEQFPGNHFLLSNLAGYYYYIKKDLEKAHIIYKQLHEASPYRLESMDDYSIVLFLRGDRVGLSSLAQQVYNVDPFRAESNYVVGNYYVLMGAHDRGVLHFRRAVAADPKFIAAWTLLGHAYLETKNSAAAVEAYRAAVDLDQRDYRGWYNLGQIYELLQFYHHALYYYWQTAALRPTDPRMWSAVANCLDREGRTREAMQCLEHAETCENPRSEFYPPLVRRLGLYYLSMHEMERAVTYLEKLVAAEARKREDVLLAVPHIVSHYLRQAKQLLEITAQSLSHGSPFGRSVGAPVPKLGGSCLETEDNGDSRGSFHTAAGIMGNVAGRRAVAMDSSGLSGDCHAEQWPTTDLRRQSTEARWEQAAICLVTAEGHLENLAGALGFPSLQAAVESATVNRPMDYDAGDEDLLPEEGRLHTAQLLGQYRNLKGTQHVLSNQLDMAFRGQEERRGR